MYPTILVLLNQPFKLNRLLMYQGILVFTNHHGICHVFELTVGGPEIMGN